MPHEGGQRFAPGSWEYRVIRAWIADGARRDPARPAARAIEIRPPESRLERPGATGRLAVVARFADGSEADVTPFCDLRVRDAEVADVSTTGAVRGLRPGDTAVVASYNGLVAAARVLVPTGRTVSRPRRPRRRHHRPRGLRQAPRPGHRALGPGRRTPSSSAGSRST